MPAHFTVNVATGRLITARWYVMRTDVDAKAYGTAVRNAVESVKQKAVICADWSQATLVAPEVAPVLLAALSGVQSKTACSVILLATEHATFNLQAERLIRDAAFEGRRTFRDAQQLLAHLKTLLLPMELEAAQSFLNNRSRG